MQKQQIYISRVLPGKEEAVRSVYAAKRRNTAPPQAHEIEFAQRIGMRGWNCWLQNLGGHYYFVHCMVTPDVKRLYAETRAAIAEGHPKALWLRDFYLDVLGKDYADPAIEPAVEELYTHQTATQAPQSERAFAFPLLPNRVAAHRSYCDLCVGDKLSELESMLRSHAVTHYAKYLQSTDQGPFVVVYEGTSGQPQPCNLPAWMSEQLEADTGLKSFEPQLEYLLNS